MGKRGKNNPKTLVSEEEYLKAFAEETRDKSDSGKNGLQTNRHGLPVMDDFRISFGSDDEPASPDRAADEMAEEEDFASLLAESLRPPKKGRRFEPKPVPLKKRIQRYPPPETELDLHGFAALGAELKAKSFLVSCQQQGFFTVRIIVGKGLHSELGPVLPDTVEDLLRELKKENIVLGFKWDRKKKARSGAVIVYLRQFND